MIALMYAGLGDKPNALREANRAIELEGNDTYFGPAAEEVLAIVEVQTGETASAMARLPKLLKSHYFSWLSYAPLTPALLRLDPTFDPLRDDPRFQELCKDEQLIAPEPAEKNASEKSIAAPPFENPSNDRQDAFFADGVQDLR